MLARCTLVTGLVLAALAAPVGAAPEAAPSPEPVRRYMGLPTGKPLVAAGLSLAVSGWGQHYNGDAEKGNMMLASLLTFPVAYGLDTLTGGSMMRVFTFVLLTGVKGWSVYDAYQHAASPTAANVAP